MEKITTVNNREIYPGYTNLITNSQKFNSVGQILDTLRDMSMARGLKFVEDLLRTGNLSLLDDMSKPQDNISESEDQRLVVVASQIRFMIEELMKGNVKNILDREEGRPGGSDPLVSAFKGNGFHVRFLDEHPAEIDLGKMVYELRSHLRESLSDVVMLGKSSREMHDDVLVTALIHPDSYDVLNTERFTDDLFAGRGVSLSGDPDDHDRRHIMTRVRPDRFRPEEGPLVLFNEIAKRHDPDGIKYMIEPDERQTYQYHIAPGSLSHTGRIFC
jgi:hypothetical protein